MIEIKIRLPIKILSIEKNHRVKDTHISISKKLYIHLKIVATLNLFQYTDELDTFYTYESM